MITYAKYFCRVVWLLISAQILFTSEQYCVCLIDCLANFVDSSSGTVIVIPTFRK